MHYRPLKRTGQIASEIGFGTWGLGGTHRGAVAYGPTRDAESVRALRRAFDLGVTFFDTSDLYGYGHSETLLGKEFADVRSHLVLATKAGFVDGEGKQDFSPTHLSAALEESLRRLRTDYVDLFLLHSPPVQYLNDDPDILHWLESIQHLGKTRAVGISVRSPEDGLMVARNYNVDAIQVNFNLADQRAAHLGLLDLCAERGIGVIVRTPLCFGFLSGVFNDPSAFAATDHRSRWPSEQRARWHAAAEVFAPCRAERAQQTAAQFALRFCLSYPSVWTVIPGMLTADQVEENVQASELGPLSEDELEQVEGLYREQEFFLSKPREAESGKGQSRS